MPDFKNLFTADGEMVQQLRAFVALSENQSSVPASMCQLSAGSQPSITLAPGHKTPSSILCRHPLVFDIHRHRYRHIDIKNVGFI